ncbi:BPSS1780 family membrane protein [Pseudoduganella albidiflava]|uniref:BPSS1780 family membrane protein n=1 Tax=Pseudoduganella albidiflava TaxID=321983 RepID=UPI0021A8B558|nr:BPSS1780 family membrane protein [Pseudoduganella albidiflava]
MNHTPARSGWEWVKQGFGMLKKQPAGLSTLFFGYMLLSTLLLVVPLAGQIAHYVLMPVFAIGFMTAAREIGAGKPVMPGLLVAGFRGPSLRRLCVLGVIHLLVFLAAGAIGVLLFADTEALRNATPAELQTNPQLLLDSGLVPTMATTALLYIPALLVISFAAPLVHWNGMGPGKALFYSFFAIKRAAGAFFMFAVSLFAITIAVLLLVRALFGFDTMGLALMRMLSEVLYGVAHCALYVAYVHIFPPAQAAADPFAKP